MSMTLTKDDLEAIRQFIKPDFDSLENRVLNAVDSLAQQKAAGFAEVHHKIDRLEVKVDRIDRTLQAEIMRNDHQDEAVNRMRKALHAA